MERPIHPAEIGLFTAAALRGYRLGEGTDGCYRVFKIAKGVEIMVMENASFKDVANLCGAIGKVTLKEAAERDGLRWPLSAKNWLNAIGHIGGLKE